MVDWNSLKPLKLHRKILTFVIVFLLLFLIFAPKNIYIISSNFKNDEPKVTAKSGLKIRTNPSLNSEIITTVKFGENIKVIDNEIKKDIVNGENGNWCKVEYRNQTGYAWNKFISE
jgi:uncharacterized protein YgiM (DUF1202 family)